MKKELVLPNKLNKDSIRRVVIDFWAAIGDKKIGSLDVYMNNIEFVEPSGIISLYNILEFAKSRKDIKIICHVLPEELLSDKKKQAMYYLEDCGFF